MAEYHRRRRRVRRDGGTAGREARPSGTAPSAPVDPAAPPGPVPPDAPQGTDHPADRRTAATRPGADRAAAGRPSTGGRPGTGGRSGADRVVGGRSGVDRGSGGRDGGTERRAGGVGSRDGGADRRGAPRRQRRHSPDTPVPRPPRHAPTPAPTEPDRRPGADERARSRTGEDPGDGERGLRGLVGAGSSQLSTGAAMRARDATRPSADDLAAADRELTIVRRHWVPRDPA